MSGRAEKGDVIVLDGERLFVRERDRSALSPNLGLLVCPIEAWEAGDDFGSRWTRRDDYAIEEKATRKRGVVQLRAMVTSSPGHDLEEHLEEIRQQFANRFSCYVHEFYPSAIITTEATVTLDD